MRSSLKSALKAFGDMYDVEPGGQNKDEAPAFRAGAPDSAFTYDGITTSGAFLYVLENDIADADSGTGRYFVNQDILVPFEMEMANGQPVIGYGYLKGIRESSPEAFNTIMLGESFTDTYSKDGQQMDYWYIGSPQTGGWNPGGEGQQAQVRWHDG